jgi:hypothetical protein
VFLHGGLVSVFSGRKSSVLQQGTTNVFCKGPDNKYILALCPKIGIGNVQMNGCGCVSIKLYL